MKTACLFPGQGSQFAGMARELYETRESARRRFDLADEILKEPLSRLMFEGPAEKLRQTEFTQPAIFLHSVALFETLDLRPDLVAGHSLGEFSAIAAAGAFSFEDGLRLVALRGSLMQQAGDKAPGTMAAVIGMKDEEVEAVCEEAAAATSKPVAPANYNSPGQLVISGDLDAVKKAMELAKERGCRLVKQLPVSGAFHSSLMEPAVKEFQEALEKVPFTAPKYPVYSNYTAEPVTEPDTLRENLVHQLVNPVKWTQTLEGMNREGAGRFVEIGPGNVLQGLVKRTLKEVEISGHQ